MVCVTELFFYNIKLYSFYKLKFGQSTLYLTTVDYHCEMYWFESKCIIEKLDYAFLIVLLQTLHSFYKLDILKHLLYKI